MADKGGIVYIIIMIMIMIMIMITLSHTKCTECAILS